MVIVNAYIQGKAAGLAEGTIFIASPRKTAAMEYQPILESKRGSIMQMMTATAYQNNSGRDHSNPRPSNQMPPKSCINENSLPYKTRTAMDSYSRNEDV